MYLYPIMVLLRTSSWRLIAIDGFAFAARCEVRANNPWVSSHGALAVEVRSEVRPSEGYLALLLV